MANAASAPPGASNPPVRSGWTPIPNAIISHPELTGYARMILIWLLSHTPEYLATVNAGTVERAFPGWSRQRVAAALKGLEAAGYLDRARVQVARGRWEWAPWVIRATPTGDIATTPTELPVTDIRSTDVRSTDVRSVVLQSEDQGENTSREDQFSELDDDDLARAREQNHHVENPEGPEPGPAAAVAGTAPPDLHPPLPATDTGTAGPTAGSKETGGQAPADGSPVDLVQALIDAVHQVTGRTIDRDLAGKGVAMVLCAKDGTPRAVSDPVAYLRTAVEAAPTRFLPSMVPPSTSSSARCQQHGLRQPCDHCTGRGYGSPRGGRFDYPQRETPEIDPDTGWPAHMNHGRRESKQERTSRVLDEFAASAAHATAGGQRLDNTGVTVVDQDGQAAGTAPAEPLSDPWTTGTTPGEWMATPARQRAADPHVCRYGCRFGQHLFDDPETGVPTRCPIHHDHARHREAA